MRFVQKSGNSFNPAFKSKLLSAGFSDEDVKSFDRSTCLEKWAALMVRDIDQLLSTTPQSPQSLAYDVEVERERLRLKERELAL